MGLRSVPVIELEHLNDAQKRALMLADNKIALNAGWDMDLLANELADLSSMDLEFNLELTGFEVADIDIIIDSASDHIPDEAEVAPVPDEAVPVVTGRGDLWHLGKHRVLCGDARSPEDFAALVGESKADMVFTDPPYNVPIAGHVSGKGRARHREFHEASGEMTRSGFTAFLDEVLANTSHSCRNGAISFVCMDWRHMGELLEAGQRAFDAYLNLCVWAKTNGGMGSLYRSQHELVFVFRKGKVQHRNNVQLGRYGRNRTNVWTYAGSQHLPGRPDGRAFSASDCKASRHGAGCDPGRKQTRRDRARPLLRGRGHTDGGRAVGQGGLCHGYRSGLCRCCAQALANRNRRRATPRVRQSHICLT